MKIDLAKSGNRALSQNIPEFAKINEMPIPLDIRRIAEGDGIDAAFIKKTRQNFTEFRTRCLFLTDETFFKM
jgi:hypothetical protein